MNKSICTHRFISQLIAHDDISHPTGPQFCVYCKKTFDELVKQEMWEPSCSGCGKHESIWKTLVKSCEWKAWYKFQQGEDQQYDTDEAQEIGAMSKNHWNDFVKFIKRMK